MPPIEGYIFSQDEQIHIFVDNNNKSDSCRIKDINIELSNETIGGVIKITHDSQKKSKIIPIGKEETKEEKCTVIVRGDNNDKEIYNDKKKNDDKNKKAGKEETVTMIFVGK